MLSYIVKRILVMIPTLMIISMLSYMMMRIAPGDPVKANMMASGGNDALKEGESQQAKQFRKYFGLDKPWYVGYWYWLTGNPNIPGSKGVIRGDFGISLTVSLGTPVTELLKERLPPTLKLNIIAMALIYLIAIPAGIYSSVKRNSIFDRGSSIFFLVLYSLPNFWVGLLLIILSAKFFPWWPTRGLDPDLPLTASYWNVIWQTTLHYIFPVICLSYGSFAMLSRYSRTAMLEIIKQDYIRTARAKGLSEPVVILKHVLRNGMIPLITIFAGMLPGLISGSFFIEYLFRIPGMGLLGLEAVSSRDYPLLMTIFGFSAALTLMGILLSDICYCLVDPRISLNKSSD